MPEPLIYLDYNATAPILPAVADAVREAALRYPGNPASQHEAGRQARRALEAARQRIGELLGARITGMDADRVIFTSGGTESNNLALTGLHKAGDGIAGTPPRVLTTPIEHPSIARCAEHLAIHCVNVDFVPVDQNGVIQLNELEQIISARSSGPLPLEGRAGEGVRSGYTSQSPLPNPPPQGEGTGRFEKRIAHGIKPTLASIMLANNETGVLQPIAEAAAICRQHGVLLHTDATQAVGKIPIDFQALGVDALTAAAHKFHGPQGIGILVVRHGVHLEPALHGGFQQAEARPGTESVALAVGMQTALELWHAEADVRRERMTALRDQLERAILAGYDAAVVIGANAHRLPHTSNIAFVGLNRQALVMALDLAGIACSTGSACASGSSEPSPTLVAMGLPEEQISSSLRFSLGATTTAAEIDEATRRILSVCNHLRQQ